MRGGECGGLWACCYPNTDWRVEGRIMLVCIETELLQLGRDFSSCPGRWNGDPGFVLGWDSGALSALSNSWFRLEVLYGGRG